MLILASAKGFASEARIPVKEKSNGPSTFKAFQPVSVWMPAGTFACGQTMESSSRVLVIEVSTAGFNAHAGICAAAVDLAGRKVRVLDFP